MDLKINVILSLITLNLEGNMKKLLGIRKYFRFSKKETSVAESPMNILNRTMDEVNSNFRSMNTRIEYITHVLKGSYYVYNFLYGNKTVRFFN